jgi:hypothetical protein
LLSWKKSMLMSMHRLLSSTKSVDIKSIKLDLLLPINVLLVSNHGFVLFASILWALSLLLQLSISVSRFILISVLINLYSHLNSPHLLATCFLHL